MKAKLVLALTSYLIMSSVGFVLADVPSMMSYQGRLTDNSGQPVPDGSYSLAFAIYDVAEGGEPLWSEGRTVSTQDGLFAVELGSVNPIPASVFENSPRYLGMAVNGDTEQSPRSQLTTAPYAFQAAIAPATSGQSPATDWICPYFRGFNFGGQAIHVSVVTICNPNAQATTFTLTFYSWAGEQLDECTFSVLGHGVSGWGTQDLYSCLNVAPDGIDRIGWFSVHSEIPISLWGYTLSNEPEQPAFAVPLSFYVP